MAGKVTVVGAGFYGSTTAQRIAEYNIVDEVVRSEEHTSELQSH